MPSGLQWMTWKQDTCQHELHSPGLPCMSLADTATSISHIQLIVKAIVAARMTGSGQASRDFWHTIMGQAFIYVLLLCILRICILNIVNVGNAACARENTAIAVASPSLVKQGAQSILCIQQQHKAAPKSRREDAEDLELEEVLPAPSVAVQPDVDQSLR